MNAAPNTTIAEPHIAAPAFTGNKTLTGPSFLDAVVARIEGKADGPSDAIVAAVEIDTGKAAAPTPEPETQPKPSLSPRTTKVDPNAKGLDALFEDEPDTGAAAEPEEDFLKDIPADAKTPEAVNAWTGLKKEVKSLKGERESLAKENGDLKSRLETGAKLQDADPLKLEIEKLRTRTAEQEKIVAAFEITQSDEYKNVVEKPLARLGTEAAELAKRCDVDAQKLFDALSEPNLTRQKQMLLDVAGDMDDLDKGLMYDMARETRKIYQREDDLKASAKDAAAEIIRNRKEAEEKGKTESKAAQMREVDDMVKKLSSKTISRFLAGDDETPEAAIAALHKSAQETPWDEMTPNQRAFAAVASQIVVKAQHKLVAQERRIKELEAAVGSYSNNGPKTGKQAAVAQGTVDKSKSFVEALFGGK